jgi:hypothetical protein
MKTVKIYNYGYTPSLGKLEKVVGVKVQLRQDQNVKKSYYHKPDFCH